MAPLLIPIVTMLAEKGMSLLSKAINSGSDKAKEYIEENTGIKLDKGLTDEQVTELKKFEITNKLELEKLALFNKQEDNRHEEKYIEVEIGDKQNARAAASLGPVQTDIANKVYNQSAWAVPLLLVLNALLIVFAGQLHLDTTAIVAVGNLIGIALSNQYRERQSVLEFLFGASIDKKGK